MDRADEAATILVALERDGVGPARVNAARRAGTLAALAAGGDRGRHEATLSRASALGIDFVLDGEEDYPERLSSWAARPPLLWVRGDPRALARRGVAVVGTRQPTAGREAAEVAARTGVARDLVIHSGLALGIDGAAHAAALAAGGVTVASVATGLDACHPLRHRDLAEQIVSHGALVSTYPPGETPEQRSAALVWRLAARNQLVARLSLGSIVGEAREGSGTLGEVDHALRAGRPVVVCAEAVTAPDRGWIERLAQRGLGVLLVRPAADAVDVLLEHADTGEQLGLPGLL